MVAIFWASYKSMFCAWLNLTDVGSQGSNWQGVFQSLTQTMTAKDTNGWLLNISRIYVVLRLSDWLLNVASFRLNSGHGSKIPMKSLILQSGCTPYHRSQVYVLGNDMINCITISPWIVDDPLITIGIESDILHRRSVTIVTPYCSVRLCWKMTCEDIMQYWCI